MDQNPHIFLVPFNEVDTGFVTRLAAAVSARLETAVGVGPRQPMPQRAFDWRRRQYRSGAFLALLGAVRQHLAAGNGGPASAPYLLGVCDVDLFVPQLNFVFGEADRVSGVAVISLTRLREQFYGRPADGQLLEQRALKEAIHELGHVYGLSHCPNPHCIMHFSNLIEDTDRKGPEFCAECDAKLRQLVLQHG